MQRQVLVNGELVAAEAAAIPAEDGGFLFGNGVFETMRTYSGRVFRLSWHLDRLRSSARFLGIPLEEKGATLEEDIEKTLRANRISPAYVKVVVSGPGRGNPPGKSGPYATRMVIVDKLVPYPESLYRKGCWGVLVGLRRNNCSPLPGHKTLSYLDNLLAKREVEAKGAQEGLFLDTEGYLSEGSTSNIFLLRKGGLVTPSLDSGILPGVTRRVVLEICSSLNMRVEERRTDLSELLWAEEAFLTNSLMEIMPLTKLDTQRIGGGRPGTITQRLRQEYRRLTGAIASP